jgi:hypothetical protein
VSDINIVRAGRGKESRIVGWYDVGEGGREELR